VTGDAVHLSEPQRDAIASRLARLLELIAKLRDAGVQALTLELLEEQTRATAAITGAQPPPRPLGVHALISAVLVTIMELEPRRLRGFGELDAHAAERLEHERLKLYAIASQLDDELRHGENG